LQILQNNPSEKTINQLITDRGVYFKRVNPNASADYISKHWVGDARVRGADDIARQVRDGEISPQEARKIIEQRVKHKPAFRTISHACRMISKVEKLSYYPKKAEDRQKLVRNLMSQLCEGKPVEKITKTCQRIIDVNTLIPELKRAKISGDLAKRMKKRVRNGQMELQDALKRCKDHQWQKAIEASRKPVDDYTTAQVLAALDQVAADHRHMLARITRLQELIESGQVDDLSAAMGKIKEWNARYRFSS